MKLKGGIILRTEKHECLNEIKIDLLDIEDQIPIPEKVLYLPPVN